MNNKMNSKFEILHHHKNELDGVVMDKNLVMCKWDFIQHPFINDDGMMEMKDTLSTSWNPVWLKINQRKFKTEKLLNEFMTKIERLVVANHWDVDAETINCEKLSK